MVQLPELPLLRARLGLSGVRRLARPAPRGGLSGLSPLWTSRGGAGALLRLRLAVGRAPRRRNRAPRARACRGRSATATSRCSGSTPTSRRRATGRAAVLRRFEAASAGRADRYADGGQGPRLPGRLPRRGARRRRDAALPGLPRRGADVRARGAARRPRGPGRRRARARADDGPGGARDRLRGPARQRRLPPGGAASAGGASLSAVRASHQGRLLGAGGRRSPLARRRRWPQRARLGNAQLLGPAPLFRLRGRERSQLVIKAPERQPAVAAVGDAVAHVAALPECSGAHFSVDVDPQ